MKWQQGTLYCGEINGKMAGKSQLGKIHKPVIMPESIRLLLHLQIIY
jgi:hypothetical protein